MRPPLIDMILSQIMFWGITLYAAIICYRFYQTVDGKLRVLMIELFISKIWAYAIAGLFFLLWDMGYLDNFPQIYMRLVCNLPMLIVMYRLERYIRPGGDLHNPNKKSAP